MPYFLVSDFRGGLDVRKSPWTAEAGTLQKFTDGHITRGGEIEKRKEFTTVGALLEATHSLGSARSAGASSLIVFGSDPAPAGLPAGVIYQRLQHPDGTAVMVDVAAMTLFDGLPFVAADFSDGSQFVYYNGQLVTDWAAGIVRPSMTSNPLIAEHLRSLIDADANYTATRSGSQVTVVGLPGVEYAVAATTQNVSGGNSNQSITVTELEAPIAPVAVSPSIAEFAILEGSDDGGVANFIEAVRVIVGVATIDLTSGSIAFTTSAELTAVAVASAINLGTGSHGYTATTRYGKVFVYAPTSSGAGANGQVLEVVAKGDIILYNGRFAITGGTAGAGNEVAMVRVNGANVMSTAVAWATSDSSTAAAVASNIRAFASSPKMNARAVANVVYISPERIRSNDLAQFTVNVVTNGTVTTDGGIDPPIITDNPGYGDLRPPISPGIQP